MPALERVRDNNNNNNASNNDDNDNSNCDNNDNEYNTNKKDGMDVEYMFKLLILSKSCQSIRKGRTSPNNNW